MRAKTGNMAPTVSVSATLYTTLQRRKPGNPSYLGKGEEEKKGEKGGRRRRRGERGKRRRKGGKGERESRREEVKEFGICNVEMTR